jgi:hypothetical protein
MAVGWPVASAISGRLIPRIGFRLPVRVGMAIVATSSLLLTLALMRGATSGELRVGSTAFGIGMGFANTALIIAVQTSVGFSQRGVATASTMFFRNIGGTIAIGVMGVVLAQTLLASVVVRESGGAELVARILGPDRRTIDPAILRSLAGDLSSGIAHVFVIIVGLAMASMLAAAFFPAASSQSK